MNSSSPHNGDLAESGKRPKYWFASSASAMGLQVFLQSIAILSFRSSRSDKERVNHFLPWHGILLKAGIYT